MMVIISQIPCLLTRLGAMLTHTLIHTKPVALLTTRTCPHFAKFFLWSSTVLSFGFAGKAMLSHDMIKGGGVSPVSSCGRKWYYRSLFIARRCRRGSKQRRSRCFLTLDVLKHYFLRISPLNVRGLFIHLIHFSF